MGQVQVKNFIEGELVEGYYAVKDASFQTTNTGKSYIRITVADSSGAITGNMWDATKDIFACCGTGTVVKIRAVVESYRGRIQVKIDKLRPADSSEVDYSCFIPVTKHDIDKLWEEFEGYIAQLNDRDYRRIIQVVFGNEEVSERFRQSPAAKNNHHAYIGGLLEHTVSLLRYAAAFCDSSSVTLERDLLLAGTMLHDIGKIYELSLGVIIDYTDRGKLLGHLIIGSMLVEEAVRGMPEFPEEKKNLLEHMILSHHGKYEYGSPVLPAIPEAFALHHIDNLDAKTVAAGRILAEDESDNSWTERSWMLDTMLYKKGCGEFSADDPFADMLSGEVQVEAAAETKSETLSSSEEKSYPESGSLF